MSVKPRLCVATPCYGGLVTHHYLLSMMRLQRACMERGVGFTAEVIGGDALITRARNTLVQMFLADPDATHLLFIDADIGFEPDMVFEYVDFDRPLVAGIYPSKTVNWPNVAHYARTVPQETLDPASLSAYGADYVVEFEEPSKLIRDGRFARARHAGCGFMMIRRDVFSTLTPHLAKDQSYRRIDVGSNVPIGDSVKHLFFETMIDPTTGTYISEDYAFCARWRSIGGEIWVDLESKFTHVGPWAFKGDFTTQLVGYSRA